jgi:hypothetical protein
MTQNALKKHLYAILSGKIKIGNGATIQAAAGYLRASQEASGTVEKTKLLKRQEEKSLISYAQQNNLWITSVDITKYVSEGNDYYNPELGIILEDLHDENVLFRNGIYHSIDTVFYTTDTFWKLN